MKVGITYQADRLNKFTIMVDGATSNSKKLDSNDSFVPQIADRRPQIAFDPSIRSFTFNPSTQQKRRFPSPGLEPTSFLIHYLENLTV